MPELLVLGLVQFRVGEKFSLSVVALLLGRFTLPPYPLSWNVWKRNLELSVNHVHSVFNMILFPINQQTSGYGSRVKYPSSSATTDKENFSPTLNCTNPNMSSSGSNNTNSKARKSLASNWAPHDDSFSAPETPSKSLVGTSDASMLFSPPGILRETLPDRPDDSGFDNHRIMSSSTHLLGGDGTNIANTIKQEDCFTSPNNAGDQDLHNSINNSGISSSRSPPKSKASTP